MIDDRLLLADIQSWMIDDRLLLINDDKTEVLLIGNQYQLKKIDRSSSGLRVGNNDIRPVTCARNLGVWFDEESVHV